MKKRPIFKFMTFVAIVVVIAIIISMVPTVASWIAGLFGANTTTESVTSLANIIKWSGVGIILITVGVVALTSPILGVSLIVIGAVILFYTLMPIFKSRSVAKV